MQHFGQHLRFFRGDVRKLGHRVLVFAIGLPLLNLLKSGNELFAIAAPLVGEIVATQELHRPLGGLRTLAGNQV